MTDAAAHILREAKSLHQGLKENLKSRDISDKEIEIQRKNLRRQYLRLLFVHPYARESKDAETALWMQTSYALISIFKQRIAALDSAIEHPPRQAQQPNHPPRTVEYRKLLQRSRQFLAEEEKFWTQLVLRIRRHFALDEAQGALNALGVTFEDEQPTPAIMTADPATSAPASRRNQFQFPPELDGGNLDIAPTSMAQRENRVAILSKALVCLGDIARYKEQYNESGGRPRAGHEDGPPAVVGRRGRRGGSPSPQIALPRLRNYDRAQSCYEQARLLLPHDGNPSHQLAILSAYQKDTFSSLVHYYRALCVRQPYETASENMGNVLSKTLETFKNRGLLQERELLEERANGAATPRVRVEAFKEMVVVLHAQWCMTIDEAKSMGERVIKDFADLVSDRILPIDMISKVVILAQGALWKHRMVRRPGHSDRRHNKMHTTECNIVTHLITTHRVLLTNGSVELTESPPEDAADHDLAQRITATFRRTLPALRMAGKWLRANTRYISQGRRAAANPEEVPASRDGSRGRDRRHGAWPVIVGDLDAFWNEYAKFCTTLLRLFPLAELPKLRTQLEEDVEMAGFLPLRKFMMGPDGRATGIGTATGAQSPRDGASEQDSARSETSNGQSAKKKPAVPLDQVHPNEEQLMRISDILADALAIADDENTPVVFENAKFVFKGEVPLPTSSGAQSLDNTHLSTSTASIDADSDHSPVPLAQMSSVADEPDDISTASRTDDDLIREVINAALSDPSGEEDEIVWSPASGPLSPLQDPIINIPASSNQPITPPRLNPIGQVPVPYPASHRVGPLSPPHQPPLDLQPRRSSPTIIPFPPLTTAKDLLNNVLSMRTPGLARHSRDSSSPRVDYIGLGSSIWSEPKSFQYQSPSNVAPAPSNGTSTHHSQPSTRSVGVPIAPPQGLWAASSSSSQSWVAPLPAQGLNTYQQPSTLGGPLSTPFVPQHQHQSSPLNGNHRRIPSEGMSLGGHHHTYSQPAQRYDPFGYDLPTPLTEPLLPGNGMLGRVPPQHVVPEQLPSPTGLSGYGFSQNQIESAFYNAPNVGPSAAQLRRDGMLQSRYGPISSTSNIWSTTG